LNDYYLGQGQEFLFGNNFTVADAYCYALLTWTQPLAVQLETFPNLNKYFNHIKSLDLIQSGHKKMAELAGKKQR